MESISRLSQRQSEREGLVLRLSELLVDDDRVAAAWFAGSVGRGDADEFSDLDIWVIVRDEEIGQVVAKRRDFVARLGRPLLIHEAATNAPLGGGYLLTLYPGSIGPHQVDWYWQPVSRAVVPTDMRMLFDRASLPGEAAIVVPAAQRARFAADRMTYIWAMCFIAAKTIVRRQLWTSTKMLSAIRLALDDANNAIYGNQPRSHYTDNRTTSLPCTPAEQIVHLRILMGEAESLLHQIAGLGESVPREAATDVVRFVDLVEVLLKNESVEVG